MRIPAIPQIPHFSPHNSSPDMFRCAKLLMSSAPETARAMATSTPFNRLVLIRHGESQWNKENRFTGWYDVPLSDKGVEEARNGGKLIKEAGLEFDAAYTSCLKRAIKTLFLTLEESDQLWIPVTKSWRLNERHYGALTGLNKQETVDKHGIEQSKKEALLLFGEDKNRMRHLVMIWRRSYDVPPPAVSTDSEYYPGNDRRYADIPKNLLPTTESLKTTAERFLPYWKNEIFPRVLKGERLVISAHGNSLRALVMYLDQISEKDITGLNIPTACPLVYDFDEQGNVIPHPDAIAPLRGHYLGDQEVIRAKINKVANQTKKN